MKLDSNSLAGPPAEPMPQGGARASPRILVVDDEALTRQWSAHVLARSGYEVDTADDGQTAWEALHSRRYDLLLTDHAMSRVSGVELVKKVRAEDADLPVILMSGSLPVDELNRNPSLHLAATLPKPFTPAELLEIVERALRRSQGASERLEPVQLPEPGLTGGIPDSGQTSICPILRP